MRPVLDEVLGAVRAQRLDGEDLELANVDPPSTLSALSSSKAVSSELNRRIRWLRQVGGVWRSDSADTVRQALAALRRTEVPATGGISHASPVLPRPRTAGERDHALGNEPGV